MAMSDTDYAIFQSHVNRFPDIQGCPVCGSFGWQADGPFAYVIGESLDELVTRSIEAQKGNPRTTSVFRFPLELVTMTCETCFHVRQFAWLPIKSSSQRQHG